MNTAHALPQGPLKGLRTLGIHVQLTIWFMTIFITSAAFSLTPHMSYVHQLQLFAA